MTTRLRSASTLPAVRPITLALEGGGSLGAFTWGVLDRLLEVADLRIAVVSGTSAGAMNGAMLVQGLATGGPPAAKQLLETFWRRVAIAAGSLPGPLNAWLNAVTGAIAPVVDIARHAGAALSPGVSRTGINPMRGILTELLDPAAFSRPGVPELVVAATRVRTGAVRLFRGAEVGVDALLASACLPQLFPPVEIGGEAYWDGGYASNPPVRPLIEAGAPSDVLIVRTTPLERLSTPTGAMAVQERVNEITFGSALRGELRTLALAQALLAAVSDLPTPLARLRDARLHMIGAEAEFQAMHGGSRQDPTWTFLSEMHGLGVAAAERWLADN
ncbi:MAG: patatin-like phospholipase family protein, partial [Acetobacteraceae bacterium]|nr:patatin-like phospholipase family protein [Acetobacteraceae bacterium]